MIVVLPPTLVSDDYAPQRAGHASLPGPTAHLVIQSFCRCRSRAMEQLPPHLRDADLPHSRFRWSKYIFVWIVGPRHVRTFLTAPSRNNLTLLRYLLNIRSFPRIPNILQITACYSASAYLRWSLVYVNRLYSK